jgi:hypothetical protein
VTGKNVQSGQNQPAQILGGTLKNLLGKKKKP